MFADCIRDKGRFGSRREPAYWKTRMRNQRSRWLNRESVPEMAGLAMLIRGGLHMPMRHGMDAKKAHR